MNIVSGDLGCECAVFSWQFPADASVFRLPSSVFRLPSPVFRLPSPVFRLLHAGFTSYPLSISRHLLFIGLLFLSACSGMPQMPGQTAVPEESTMSSAPSFTTAEHDSEATLPPVELPTVSGALSPTGVLQLGNPDASAVLLVFTNHSCRYCREFHGHHLPRITERFVRSGQLRIDIAMHPLRKYPESTLGAMAMLCAGSHVVAMDRLLAELAPITNATVANIVKQEGWDEGAFAECMKSDTPTAMLNQLQSLADSLDATLVPTFFLNGERIVGLPEYADLQARIEETIRAAR